MDGRSDRVWVDVALLRLCLHAAVEELQLDEKSDGWEEKLHGLAGESTEDGLWMHQSRSL